MKRLSSWALPILLGATGVVLIILGSLDLDGQPASSLPPIGRPSPTPAPTATATEPSRSVVPSESATASPTPIPEDVVAVQLEVPSVGISVPVEQSVSRETDGFPPSDAAFILSSSSQPGRGTSSYIFAHAIATLFKPLWNAQLGAEVLVRMSDESVLDYEVTEIRPNVPCPDASATTNNPEDFGIELPLALQIHDDCTEGARWLEPTDHERLTLQTSQGFNRNWGELVVIAEPMP